MKKLILNSMLLIALLSTGLTHAEVKLIIIKERPVVLEEINGIYVIPQDTTSTYYSYTNDQTQYVCTTSEPVDLVNLQFIPLNVKFGLETRSVKCYPSSYFSIEP